MLDLRDDSFSWDIVCCSATSYRDTGCSDRCAYSTRTTEKNIETRLKSRTTPMLSKPAYCTSSCTSYRVRCDAARAARVDVPCGLCTFKSNCLVPHVHDLSVFISNADSTQLRPPRPQPHISCDSTSISRRFALCTRGVCLVGENPACSVRACIRMRGSTILGTTAMHT